MEGGEERPKRSRRMEVQQGASQGGGARSHRQACERGNLDFTMEVQGAGEGQAGTELVLSLTSR